MNRCYRGTTPTKSYTSPTFLFVLVVLVRLPDFFNDKRPTLALHDIDDAVRLRRCRVGIFFLALLLGALVELVKAIDGGVAEQGGKPCKGRLVLAHKFV